MLRAAIAPLDASSPRRRRCRRCSGAAPVPVSDGLANWLWPEQGSRIIWPALRLFPSLVSSTTCSSCTLPMALGQLAAACAGLAAGWLLGRHRRRQRANGAAIFDMDPRLLEGKHEVGIGFGRAAADTLAVLWVPVLFNP